MTSSLERVTLYRDPANEQLWIVASDHGDPSEENVIDTFYTFKLAEKRAKAEARKRDCQSYQFDTCESQ